MSPLFRRGQQQDKEAAALAAQRAEQSLEQMRAGGLPLAAQERMAAVAQSPVFSSDLEVNEFALLNSIGVVPITQVMGSSIYQVGWRVQYYNVPTEVHVLSDAFNESRRRALARLRQEATLAGADAVVGLRINTGGHDWAQSAVEFTAIGTAVRLPEALRHPSGEALLTDLSGQEFVLLVREGMRPVGIAAHTSVHYVPATYQTAVATGGSRFFGTAGVNQELTDFTAGVYAAREKAISATLAQARELGAEGLVGIDISEQAVTHAVKRGGYDCEDLRITFHLMGSAIREDPALRALAAPKNPLTILSLR